MITTLPYPLVGPHDYNPARTLCRQLSDTEACVTSAVRASVAVLLRPFAEGHQSDLRIVGVRRAL